MLVSLGALAQTWQPLQGLMSVLPPKKQLRGDSAYADRTECAERKGYRNFFWHQLRCQSWSFGHTQTSSTKMGSVPWETEGAGEPASTRLNVVFNLESLGGHFFLSIVSHSPALAAPQRSAHLEPGAVSRLDRQPPCLSPNFSLSSLTLPLQWLKWEGYGNYHPWDSGENTARQETGREGFQHRLSLAHSVHLENRSVFFQSLLSGTI